MKKYWLMKSEPSNYSIYDLQKEKKSLWDGVRNYQARNFMMKDMKIGDAVLFYHSLAHPPGIAGLAEVSGSARPDPTATNPKSKYYDPKATRENPRWHCVEVTFKKIFKNFISIDILRAEQKLKSMLVLKKGQRLSIMEVQKTEFDHIIKLSNRTIKNSDIS